MASSEIAVYEHESRRALGTLLALLAILLVEIVLSLAVGRYYIPVRDIGKAFLGGEVSDKIAQVLFVVRLPRVLAAVLIGGAMSLSGAAYQGMFKNPLVSPDILGSSAGAGFGAAVGILLSFSVAGVKTSSFVCGILAVSLTWFISQRFGKGSDNLFLLILGGIIVSNLFQSLISLVKYAADPTDKLPAITFWLMGSLSKATMQDVKIMLVPFAVCTGILIRTVKHSGLGRRGGEDTGRQHGAASGLCDRDGYGADRIFRVLLRDDRMGGTRCSASGPHDDRP